MSGFVPTGTGRDLFCCRPSTVPSRYLETEMAQRDAKDVCYMQLPAARAAQAKAKSGSRQAREANNKRARRRERRTVERLSAPLGISMEQYQGMQRTSAARSASAAPLAVQWRHPDYRMARACLLAPPR